MKVTRSQVESYYFGQPKCIGAKILFIKRGDRLAEYKQYLADVYDFGNVWQGISGSYQGQQLSVIAAGIGPSMIGDAVYALDRSNSTCLYSGTCGGLVNGWEIGDYFVADQSVCGDGFSLHLGQTPWSIVTGDPPLLNSLTELLVKKVAHLHHGLAFTTSSVVREADPNFWPSVDEKCQIIEMGAAAFYAAAQATGKRAAAYYWVTDLPCRGKSFFEPLTSEEMEIKQARYDRVVSLDLELLASL